MFLKLYTVAMVTNWKTVVSHLQLLSFLFVFNSTDISNCPINLPQKSTKLCKNLRGKELAAQKAILQIAVKPPLLVPRVNMTTQQVVAYLSQDDFLREHFINYLGMVRKSRALSAQWIAEYPKEITEFKKYENIYNEFRRKMLEVSWKFCAYIIFIV